MEKIGEYLEAHPKIMLGACAALVAIEALRLYESIRWLGEFAVKAHLREVADDIRAASEALGG